MDKKMTSGEIAKKVGISPKAIRLYDEKGLLKPGMKLLLTGFGAGFTWAGMLMEFGGSVK